MTVLGRVAARDLGITLVHEHLLIRILDDNGADLPRVIIGHIERTVPDPQGLHTRVSEPARSLTMRQPSHIQP